MTAGIVAWGTYLPYWRLDRKTIGLALGQPSGRGTRTVASYDEDTTTLGVEAARQALGAPGAPTPEVLLFSTPAPPYLDKTNATAIAAALGLPGTCGAYDLCGSSRSGVAALMAAATMGQSRPALAVLSDLRTGLSGGPDERDGGDGAVAFLWAPDGASAEVVGRAAASDEFLDRWRVPGETDSHVWEERFGEDVYVPLAHAAFADALKAAGVTAAELDHVVVSGLHARAVRVVKGGLGVRGEALAPDRSQAIGNLGVADAGVAVADVLERAEPGQLIAVLVLADGADAVVLRTTDALPAARAGRTRTVERQAAGGRADLPYIRFLTWRGEVEPEPPRRPDPERPGAPTAHRAEGWKYGFNASRCLRCGFRHLPPTRVCLNCHAIDEMEPERLADTQGTVATFTVDRLAFSLSPPVVGVVVDFDGGGRFRCEMTDVDPGTVHIGQRVEMTFRRLWTAQGVHNYFWKAKPVEGSD
ncbi:MAG TPA: OB-fold domain-containing protein [Acidimicrobiales bacterium]|nr:OB-fold domain-containing protein [Acidimicrobiales bacterium]